MPTHNSVAADVRKSKEAHPENYCSNARCLWRVMTRAGHKPCPRHPVTTEKGAP